MDKIIAISLLELPIFRSKTGIDYFFIPIIKYTDNFNVEIDDFVKLDMIGENILNLSRFLNTPLHIFETYNKNYNDRLLWINIEFTKLGKCFVIECSKESKNVNEYINKVKEIYSNG